MAGGIALVVLALLVLLVVEIWPSSGAPSAPASHGPPSIEAGVESWQLPYAVSRETVVASPAGLTVLGGLTPSGSSLASTLLINPASGAIHAAASLAKAVHDASGAVIADKAQLFGGGSPNTVATVQTAPLAAGGTGSVTGALPQPRSDSAAVTVSRASGATSYVVGGYDGTTYLPGVLSTKDGTNFSTVATLKVPVRYAAVAAAGGNLFVFGGQTASSGSTVAATTDIQRVDPSTHAVDVIGHLPQPLYGASAFNIGGTIYVAGGETPGGITLTAIEAFVPSTAKVLAAGLLPQAVAFGGAATVGVGPGAIGYLVGGEVARQQGIDQAGVASGTLRTVLSLRVSRYGGAAGSVQSGSPYLGNLLIADRGNDRLLVISPGRRLEWVYPSATKPAPPGGFYFPDDAFFFDKGKGIISNQEQNHTIVEIGYPSGRILWAYGHPGKAGSTQGYLNQPDDAYLLKSGVVTVADASNNRILFISAAGRAIGQIGNGVPAHVPGVSIDYPNGDTPLADGNVLISEITGAWVDEYTPSGHMVWSVHMPQVNYPSDPQQLGSNLYLMCDYNPPGEGRVLTFDRSGKVYWVYDAKSGDAALHQPSLAERLPNGLIMVNDDYRDRVVVIDPKTHSIVWQYGLTDVPGTRPGYTSIPDGFDLLNPGGVTPTHPQTK
jgi:hypothetical protein